MRTRSLAFAVGIFVFLLGAPAVVYAQIPSSGGSTAYGGTNSYGYSANRQGMFGASTSLGSSLISGRSSMFGNSGSLGQTMLGGSMLGQSGLNGGMTNQQGRSGMMQQQGMNANPMSGMQQFNASPMWMGGFDNAQRQGAGNQQQKATVESNPIRTTYRVAFEHAETGADQLSKSLSQRLATTSSIRCRNPILVQVQGRTAILQGLVPAEHDRVLAEQLVRLQPEISAVQNEIVVEASPRTELSLPEPPLSDLQATESIPATDSLPAAPTPP